MFSTFYQLPQRSHLRHRRSVQTTCRVECECLHQFHYTSAWMWPWWVFFFFFLHLWCVNLLQWVGGKLEPGASDKENSQTKISKCVHEIWLFIPPAPYIFKYVFDRLQTAGVKVDEKSVSTHGSRWKRSLQKETAAWCECTSSAQRNPTKHVTGCVNRTVRDNRSRQELPSTATVEKQHRVCEYFTDSVYRLPSFRNV